MNDSPIGRGYAHGKIILLGEHSAVYHKPAIAIPFPKATVTVTVTPSVDHTRIDCDFYHGLLKDMPELLESLKETIRLSLLQVNKENDLLHITINSTIPAERGMGSSAAISVATVRALFDYFSAPLNQKTLLEIVDISEKIAHGNPSGLDALTTSSSFPCYHIKNEISEYFTLNIDGYLVVGDTGITGQTKEAVLSIAQKWQGADERLTKSAIADLGELAQKGRFFLETNQPLKLGLTMTRAHQILDSLGVSSPDLNRLVMTALSNNALGAKLTGGGRGGCMIALAEDRETAETIASQLKKNGAKKTWIYQLGEKINENNREMSGTH